jgi:hypothetical protein
MGVEFFRQCASKDRLVMEFSKRIHDVKLFFGPFQKIHIDARDIVLDRVPVPGERAPIAAAAGKPYDRHGADRAAEAAPG